MTTLFSHFSMDKFAWPDRQGKTHSSLIDTGTQTTCFTALALQMPDIFSSSGEFQSWFDSWATPETEAQAGTDGARAAQREEQVCRWDGIHAWHHSRRSASTPLDTPSDTPLGTPLGTPIKQQPRDRFSSTAAYTAVPGCSCESSVTRRDPHTDIVCRF